MPHFLESVNIHGDKGISSAQNLGHCQKLKKQRQLPRYDSSIPLSDTTNVVAMEGHLIMRKGHRC
ncbi:hypothetical protein APTSU1_000088900 [Apodemus speciosus]|uniref:Uncharacterized protein n=1 Tax=Apodemus speciosus TaxID=105296 RepID=A0ABQ0EEV1_APOSI